MLSASECHPVYLAECLPECPRHQIDSRLIRATRRCEEQLGAKRTFSHISRMGPVLKFGAAALTAFDFVVFADVDLDLLPDGDLDATATRWSQMAPAVLRSKWPEFVANADSMAPVNGAVFIVRPSEATFSLGLRVLRRCQFNASHGWDWVGPPRSLRTDFR